MKVKFISALTGAACLIAIAASLPSAQAGTPLAPACPSTGPVVGQPCARADGALLYRDSVGGEVVHHVPTPAAPPGWWAYADRRYVLTVSPAWVIRPQPNGGLDFTTAYGQTVGGLRPLVDAAPALPNGCTASAATNLGNLGRAVLLHCAELGRWEQDAVVTAPGGLRADLWVQVDGPGTPLPSPALTILADSLRPATQ